MKAAETKERQAFEAVKGARAALKQRREDVALQLEERQGKASAPPSPQTVDEYVRIANRLIGAAEEGRAPADVWTAAMQTAKVGTWRKRVSALLFVATARAEQLLEEQDKMQRTGAGKPGHTQHAIWLDAVERAHLYASIIASQPGEKIEGTGRRKCPLNPEAIERRASKRRVGAVPPDWRERLAVRLPNWRAQYLTQAVTGCRPVELAKGVRLVVKGGHLVAEVNGGKLSEYAGQKVRALAWRLDDAETSSLLRDLADLVREAGGALTVSFEGRQHKDPRKSYSNAIEAAARREWPNNRTSITAYSLRHAMGGDLKASGLSREDWSAAMGHQVTKTISTYGMPRRRAGGGKSVAPVTVKATTEVRKKAEPWAGPAVHKERKAAARKAGVRSHAPMPRPPGA